MRKSVPYPADRFAPPETVLELARRLRGAGHEAWCVGGAVRDALLGQTNLDWDIATSAHPREVQRLFRRTVDIGIRFGTVGVLDRDGVMHEVTTFRRDIQTDGRHAVVEFGASLDDDLARRDFTINAIAYDPLDGRLHDPFGGRRDLDLMRIRAVGVPAERMEEDRLRALRAIRFAARLEFGFDADTWDAVVASTPFLGRLSPERVKQEIEKTVEQVERPSEAFRFWREAGAFAAVVPALDGVSDETLRAVDMLPRPGLRGRPARKLLRLAALFSELDWTRTERALRALRFSNQDTAFVAGLVGRWHEHGRTLTHAMRQAMADGRARPGDAELRRLAADVGRLRAAAFVRLAHARWCAAERSGTAEPIPASMVRGLHRRMLRIAFHDAIEVGDLAVDGDDLRAHGIPAGPQLGRLLSTLLAEVIETPTLNERDTLLRHARTLSDAMSAGDAARGHDGRTR